MSISNYIVHSDYPMDEIVWTSEGMASSSSMSGTDTVITHGLPFAPLVFGQFSLDGSTWYPMNMEGFYTIKMTVSLFSDKQNVRINVITNRGAVTIRYRLWAFAAAGEQHKLPRIASANQFRFNTGYNYSKLVKAGVWNVVEGNEQVIYAHNLGYIPSVMAWQEESGGVIQSVPQSDGDYQQKNVTVTDNELRGRFGAYINPAKIHYRIYGGQND